MCSSRCQHFSIFDTFELAMNVTVTILKHQQHILMSHDQVSFTDFIQKQQAERKANVLKQYDASSVK